MKPRIQGTPKIIDQGPRSFMAGGIFVGQSPEFRQWLAEIEEKVANGYSCYRREKIERRAGSAIEGRGLFATAPIEKDEMIAIKTGRVVNEAAVRQMTREGILHGSQQQIGRDEFLVGLTESEEDENLVGYNHSCDPSAMVLVNPTKPLAIVMARRDIAPGEEITADYSVSQMTNTHRLLCRCKSPQCRGIVQPRYDFLHSVVRERYKGEFAWYIQYFIDGIARMPEPQRVHLLSSAEFAETAGKIVVLSDEIERLRSEEPSRPRSFWGRALMRSRGRETGFHLQSGDDLELVEKLLAWSARYMTSYPMQPRVELDKRTPVRLKDSIKEKIDQIVFCAQMHDEAAGWEHEFPVNVRLLDR